MNYGRNGASPLETALAGLLIGGAVIGTAAVLKMYIHFGPKYERVPNNVGVEETFNIKSPDGTDLKCVNPGIKDEEFGGYLYDPRVHCKPISQ